jgi:uncharacterized protein YigE (DUF2233 family)
VIRALLVLLAGLIAGPVPAQTQVPCQNTSFDGNRYAVCDVDVTRSDLRLFLYDDSGAVYGQFGTLNRSLQAQGKQLGFAMNAGMYHKDRMPVGYYVENGTEQMRVIANAGPGNFGMLPNGIFCIRPGRADVIETLTFQRRAAKCTYATQSGPMLVIEGALHPRFLPDSTSRYLRNGVGTNAGGGRAVFVISRGAVTFYDFARFFRDGLGLPNALYLDGNISRLYAPALNRNDAGFAMGPIVGVVVDETQ